MWLNYVIPSFKDPIWLFALIAGPIFWLLYLQVVQPDQVLFDLDYFIFFVLAVFVYPVLEEIVFRGWIQAELIARNFFQTKYLAISFANWVTSLLFSFFHLFNHDPVWAGLVFFPSLLFGYLRDQYQSITPSILLHVYYNSGLSIVIILHK